MENKTYYHYTFEPLKLKEQRAKVEKVFKDVEQSHVKLLSRNKLPKLLELIRQVSFDGLETIAQQLKKMEVLVLLYDYPFKDESHETRRKINLILTHRYSVQVGMTAWDLFQHDPHDVFLQELLRLIYNTDQFEFLVSEEKANDTIRTALLERAGIVTGLITSLLASKQSTQSQLSLLKVQQDSLLEKELLKGVLLGGLSQQSYVQRDGVDFIVGRLERYEMDEYKGLIGVYLESRSFKDFEYALMTQAIKRLEHPLEHPMHWDTMSPSIMEQVQKWLLHNKMKQFFEQDEDNARFDYWKNYLNQDYILDVDVIKNPKAAFIYFERFVVVEFGIIGAAYFYHRVGFERIIKLETRLPEFRDGSKSKREEILKRRNYFEQDLPLFIDRHGHHGFSWPQKFTMHMRNYLDGRF